MSQNNSNIITAFFAESGLTVKVENKVAGEYSVTLVDGNMDDFNDTAESIEQVYPIEATYINGPKAILTNLM